jgi:asparagine synthase (glutamine-hydrolysing)
MSVQFGRWNFAGKPMDPEKLARVERGLRAYGPDGSRSCSQGGTSIIYSALHTTSESHRELQPYCPSSGVVITWDGRLDNRDELLPPLSEWCSRHSTDVAIVAAAYNRWGTACFGRLLGDWALAIWNPDERSLILAKDFLGARQLYYALDGHGVTWSTLLEPLVLLAEHPRILDEEYLAGWLGLFPDARLTPYRGISGVPPSSFVRIGPSGRRISRYWDFDLRKRICYRSDGEYEEHFRGIFAEAVRRRLRSQSPVLAELSGGMDSSAIVCMADLLLERGSAEAPRLDTLSYYNDAEPNWNEQPYFRQVEEQRGRVGSHIEVGSETVLPLNLERDGFRATPAVQSWAKEATRRVVDAMAAGGNRVVLSGIGGDEVLGGVPTPLPELADLLARGRCRLLARRLREWSLLGRRPWFHLFAGTVGSFLPAVQLTTPGHLRALGWVRPGFARRYRDALAGYPARWKLFGPLPSQQSNLGALEVLRRQLACSGMSSQSPFEKRYPYLDRDLLEFVYAIPRDQILRPGRRRSLMRRALRGIVPEQILNRRRKAFVARAPLLAIASQWTVIREMTNGMVSEALGIVDSEIFRETLQSARAGREVPLVPLVRTLQLESWLRWQRHGKI